MGLWTFLHAVSVLPTFCLMLIISLLMRKFLIQKPFEIRMLPIKIIAVIMILIEIGKQIYSASIGYNLYHIPLHFCSIFVFILPIFAFYRGKWEDNLRSVACAAMLSLFFGMLVMPNVIYSSSSILSFFGNYLSFHTVFSHNLVIFAFFLTLSLDLHTPTASRAENTFVILFGAAFVIISATMAHVLQTNFSNFLYSTVGFVSDLVEELKLLIGELPVTIIYTATLCFLHVVLLLLTNCLFKLVCLGKEKVVGLVTCKEER